MFKIFGYSQNFYIGSLLKSSKMVACKTKIRIKGVAK